MTAAVTTAPLIAAALAGFAGSPHCVGMCGPFAAVASRTKSGGVAWHVGRLATYVTLGALAGALGGAIPGPGWVIRAVAAVLLVGLAARLAGLLPQVHLSAIPGLRRAMSWATSRPGAWGALALGSLSGLMPCGLVYAALAIPIAVAEPGTGALSMLFFGLGTVPLLGLLSGAVHRLMQRSKTARYGLAVIVLITGLSAIGTRSPAVNGEPPDCHEP